MRAGRLGMICAVFVFAAGCAPGQGEIEQRSQQLILQATLVLVPPHCAGVVVGDGAHALTAAHCLDDDADVRVQLSDGQILWAQVASIDRGTDLALLRFDAPAPVMPLEVAPELPAAGSAVLFAGRGDRPAPMQVARVRQLGRCPSLPAVPDALFTTVEGEKGDSGAPLVDERLRVVGLVHGGAACNIAAPTNRAMALLESEREIQLARQARRGPRARAPAPPPPRSR